MGEDQPSSVRSRGLRRGGSEAAGTEFAEEADGAGTANAVADFRGAVADDVVAPGAYQRRHQAAGAESCLFHVCVVRETTDIGECSRKGDWEVSSDQLGETEGCERTRRKKTPNAQRRTPNIELGKKASDGVIRGQ